MSGREGSREDEQMSSLREMRPVMLGGAKVFPVRSSYGTPEREFSTPKDMAMLLDRAGISRKRMAVRIGVDHSAVSRWVSGNRHPSRENIIRVCRAAKVSAEESAWILLRAGYAPESDFLEKVYGALVNA